jgi:hypothetical protein
LPVRYAIDGDEVVLGVQVKSVADKSTNGNVVACQADGVETNGTEWSVTVIGVARHLTAPEDMRRSEALLVPLWSKGTSRRFVAISTDHMTGRRTVEHGDAAGGRGRDYRRPRHSPPGCSVKPDVDFGDAIGLDAA